MASIDSASGQDSVTDVELDAFNQVVSALGKLGQDSRLHVWQTVGHFFHLGDSPHRGVSSGSHEAATNNGTPHLNEDRQFARRPRVQAGTDTNGTSHFTEDRQPSPKQFLLEKKPRTDVDRIACLAYYLTHYRGQTEFKTIDLSSLNTEAAQIKFSNTAQSVDNAAKSGLLVPANKGGKQLSALGEVYVSQLPDYDKARESMKEHRPFRKSRRRKSIDD